MFLGSLFSRSAAADNVGRLFAFALVVMRSNAAWADAQPSASERSDKTLDDSQQNAPAAQPETTDSAAASPTAVPATPADPRAPQVIESPTPADPPPVATIPEASPEAQPSVIPSPDPNAKPQMGGNPPVSTAPGGLLDPARRAPPASADELAGETAGGNLDDFYRPAHNPTRFNLSAHGLVATAGSRGDSFSGRLGGASVELGQSWNVMGYAVSLTALGGRLIDQEIDGRAEINVLIGGGPAITLGRLSILSRGVLDLRLGYEFFFAPATQTIDREQSKLNYAPHGPRIRVDMALLAGSGARSRFWHAMGLSMGYQALVHSFATPMPYTSVLTFGIVYWMG